MLTVEDQQYFGHLWVVFNGLWMFGPISATIPAIPATSRSLGQTVLGVLRNDGATKRTTWVQILDLKYKRTPQPPIATEASWKAL